MQASLKEFLTDLALEPAKLAAYLTDPRSAMAGSDLPREDQDVLLRSNRHEIFARVMDVPWTDDAPLASRAMALKNETYIYVVSMER
ncbi:hypothetical protein [Polyangium spumosum]|uniref:Extradiol ring-cleavage dioxygenase LigAB LigA subunit domain-containing protein n=1 Tax=Polyangium spumosum TaxID=889282 RepID=A0A6N7PUB2_9BACT|nr:hypothetical protein [Polyangium spumosum]MRG94010.1 hypothetical protein [Polyangium spumosum]